MSNPAWCMTCKAIGLIYVTHQHDELCPDCLGHGVIPVARNPGDGQPMSPCPPDSRKTSTPAKSRTKPAPKPQRPRKDCPF